MTRVLSISDASRSPVAPAERRRHQRLPPQIIGGSLVKMQLNKMFNTGGTFGIGKGLAKAIMN
jgi:hypothetical protein